MKNLLKTISLLIWSAQLIIISLLFISRSANAVENFVKIEKTTTYTYEQGLSISVDIASCLNDDLRIVKIFLNMIDRFEKETGSNNTVVMFLVMSISQEYRIGMEEKYITETNQEYIKSVGSKCKKIAEKKANVKPTLKYFFNDHRMDTQRPNTSFSRVSCVNAVDPYVIKICPKQEASSED